MKNIKYLLKTVAMIPLFVNMVEAWKEVPPSLLQAASEKHVWSPEEESLRLAMIVNPDAFRGLDRKEIRTLMQATWHHTLDDGKHPLLDLSEEIVHMDFSQGKARSVDEIIEIANDHPHSNIRFDFVLEGGYLLHFCEKVERLCEHPNVINRLSLLYLGYRVTPPQASEFIDIVANVRPQPCFGFEIDPYYLWFPRDVQALNENTNAQKCLKELCILKFGVALDISKLVNLETLNVSTVENNPNILSGLINLRTLSFGQRTNIDLKTLVQYNKLKKIVLNEFNNQDLAELPTLENITELEEIFCNISEFGWLSKLPNLKKLKLDYAQNQDHTTLPMLVKLRELGLFVKGLSQLNVIFERGPNLEDLSLFYCESGAFDSLPNLENLRKVYIDSQNVSINDIKALLSKGPSLQEIRLSRTQVTPAEIEALQLERKAQRLREVAIVKH